jgi:transcriptional regulator with AAA-type ATPase domain
MPFLSSKEAAFLQAVSKLGYCNPFLPERIEYEREALGSNFREEEPIWSVRVSDPDSPRVNLVKITDAVETLVSRLREDLASGFAVTDKALELYEVGVLFLLYRRYEEQLRTATVEDLDQKHRQERFNFYREFLRDWQHYLHIPSVATRLKHDATHLFACFFQLRRAFHLIFRYIIGSSMVAARLRAAAWQSIFTHDMRRYRDTLYERMGDVTTLISGPSGTGKELVARAIGMSRYIAFDSKKMTFAGDFSASFHALNLSALPSTLIESELLGHRRGAFTGALQDRRGWLEICEPWGTVFLDEVGDLDPSVQVKLLRILQTRTFQPLGDTRDQHFRGKIIAATNRNLAELMQQGSFRSDFYYRLCSDVIVTPSLQDQLRESPQVLRELILFVARNIAGKEAEVFADEVEAWIGKNLGRDYSWPGNVRELEQCVRSVLIRNEYRPLQVRAASIREDVLRSVTSGSLTADELLRRYCTLVYWQTGSYEQTARRLKLDRRTVKNKIDPDFLAALRAGR